MLAYTRTFPGPLVALERCRAAGLRLAVATSKLTTLAEQALARAGARHCFDPVTGNDRVRLILAVLGVVPELALLAGDAVHHIAMGCAAGLATCGVATGAADMATLRKAGAGYVATTLLELAALACGLSTSLPPGL